MYILLTYLLNFVVGIARNNWRRLE